MLCNTKFYSLLARTTIGVTIVSAIAFAPLAHAITSDAEIKASSPKILPALSYNDEEGMQKPVKTDGKPLTALHFWATWCVPCVDELVQVDQALKAYGNSGFNVIALSEDGVANIKKVKDFYGAHNITALKPNIDANMTALQALKGRGLPTTIFLDKEGKEIARAEGAVDWTSKETTDFIESHLK